jgi:hypothetical protein
MTRILRRSTDQLNFNDVASSSDPAFPAPDGGGKTAFALFERRHRWQGGSRTSSPP